MKFALFNNKSIRSKLARAFLLTPAVSLLLAGAAFVTLDIIRFRESSVETLSTLVRVVAENSTAPLSFADPVAARDTLEGLRAEPQIVYAAIFNHDGSLFADFYSESRQKSPVRISDPTLGAEGEEGSKTRGVGSRFYNGGVDVYSEISHLGDRLGAVVIRADLAELSARLYWNTVLLLAILLAVGGIAYFFSGRFQRQIAEPILALEAAMSDFSNNQNAGAFVRRSTDDEIGRLVDGFNAMIGQIRARDRRLEDTMGELSLAKVAAESANAAKSRYLATLSHEIRGPMTGVIAMSDLVLSNNDASTRRDYVGVIRRSAEVLLDFVNNVLDYSKIESGNMVLEKIDFSLARTIDSAIDSARASATSRGLKFEVSVHRDVPDTVRGDPVRLAQVLRNLVGNAVKFTESGSVYLRVNLAAEINATAPVLLPIGFEVIDTGIGISEQALEELFQPFRQADLSTARRFGGSGLGLAITKELVDLMGGRISVQSRIGDGSRFRFELTFEHPGALSQVETTPRRRQSTSIEQARAAFKGVRVLIAEDNPLNQEVASAVMAHLGCTVDLVNNGTDAVRAASATRYDLIMLDWHMPRMDGVVAAQHIKNEQTKNTNETPTPIVLTTATIFSTDDRCKHTAVDDFLPKPYRVHDVAALLMRWTTGSGALVLDSDTEVHGDAEPAGLMVDGELLDLRAIESIRELQNTADDNLIARVISLFSSHSEDLVDQLRKAIQSRHSDTAFRAAHGLKSIASNVGGSILVRFCNLLETQTKAEKWDEAGATFVRVAEIRKQTCAHLWAHKEKCNAEATGDLRPQ